MAYFISLVLHPLLLPSLLLAVLFYFTTPIVAPVSETLKLPFLGILFIMTFVFPVCTTAIWLLSRQIQSPNSNKAVLVEDEFSDINTSDSGLNFHLQNVQDRRWVFVFTSMIYVMATVLFEVKAKNPFITTVLGSVTFSLLLLTIITFFWKISAHSVGISGTLGILFAFSYRLGEVELQNPILITTVLVGLVMTARLYLDAHSPAQIAAGFFLGFIANFAAVMFLL